MAEDLTRLLGTEAIARLRTGVISVETLARAYLERIRTRDAEILAWCYLDPDDVLARARAIDAAGLSGPLYGLPIAVKDVIQTEELPTQYNSPLYAGHHPRVDAACIKLLRAGGGLMFGKTDTVEFAATGRKARTRNPHDPARTPGGSSSGSAAAVADFQAPLALGTQTGGSTIRPASFCGVFAMKPSWGLVSTGGAKPFAPSLDTLGWFARAAEDLELLYGLFDPASGLTREPKPLRALRIGVCRTPMWSEASAATQAAMGNAIDRLGAAGAAMETIDLPDEFSRLAEQHLVVMRAEGAVSFLADYRYAGDRLDAELRNYVDNHWGYTHEDVRTAYDLAAKARALFDTIAGRYDAILTPSAVDEAPLGLLSSGALTFNGIWTLLHVPCINLPGWSGEHGLPIGLTLTGPRFSDRHLLDVSQWISIELNLRKPEG